MTVWSPPPHRSSLSSESIDICPFLSANRLFVDLPQCDNIHPVNIGKHIPTHLVIGSLDDEFDTMDMYISEVFSSTSLNEE